MQSGLVGGCARNWSTSAWTMQTRSEYWMRVDLDVLASEFVGGVVHPEIQVAHEFLPVVGWEPVSSVVILAPQFGGWMFRVRFTVLPRWWDGWQM